MDRTTDTIAHFIGLFGQLEEAARLREGFEGFEPYPDADASPDALRFTPLQVSQSYRLEDLSPVVDYHPLPPNNYDIVAIPSQPRLPEALAKPWPGISEEPPLVKEILLAASLRTELLPLEMPPPSAMHGLHVLTNRLEDADAFGIGAAGVAALHAAAEAQGELLVQLAGQAQMLAAIPPLGLPGDLPTDWAGLAEELQARAEAVAAAIPGAALHLGAAAGGVHVDGAPADEMPDWLTLWPAMLRDGKDDADTDPEDPPGHDQDADMARALDAVAEAAGDAAPAGAGPEGQGFVTGGNRLVNEVVVTSDWLDASYFVVGGAARHLDAVSQLNMMSDRDVGLGEGGEASRAVNAARIVTESRPATPPPDADDAPAHSGGPSHWALARLSGDLVQINDVRQVNLVNDTDHAALRFTAGDSRIVLGENSASNLALMDAFGWRFDLVFVGGDMVDMTMLRQINLLLDDDEAVPSLAEAEGPVQPVDLASQQAATTAEGVAVSDAPLSGLDPVLPNDERSEPLAEEVEPAGGQEIEPTQAKVTQAKVTQAPADDIAAPAAAPAPAPQSPPAAVQGGDNLLYNGATLKTVGRDVEAELPEMLRDVHDTLAERAEALPEALLGLDIFDGIELLKVLLIEGDFITLNRFDQFNMLADSDRITGLAEALEAVAEAEVVTGSNLLANHATLTDLGVDSQIAAGQGVYDDLLLYQAELLDTDAAPTGVGLTDLAGEAVAFLADGMIDPAAEPLAEAQAEIAAGIAAASASPTDLLQTMLS
ncbi:hypothetical protein [Limimaricola pyoseonensis]|nr:hypothetical protein [Limimaricola pyoseonensis]